jgi:hypothetical protein
VLDEDVAATFTETRVAELGDYIKRSDGDAILREVERFGRDNPWAVMAGGVVLGIAASRFLKASGSRRYHEQESSANLPTRSADVDRDVLPAATPAPDSTTPVPGAPERELSLTGGVPPQQQTGPGARSGA